jgi:hypothetical protein
MRAFAAVPVAVVLCLAAPAFADARTHVAAARKAERKGEWRKALQAWKAAYAAEMNAEWLIGIGDAYAHLGNKSEAKKNYEAYLADPLALPSNIERVKARIAQLGPPAGGILALPAPALPLPGAEPAPTAAKSRKAEAPLPLPGLELPALPAPGKTAADDKTAMPPLPGLDLPTSSAPARKEPDKLASATPPPLPLPGVTATKTDTSPASARKDAAPAVVTKEAGKPAKPIAMVTPPAERPDKAPAAAVSTTIPFPREAQGGSSRAQRTMAYVTAGVAIAALGGGALAFTKASSAHSDLTSRVHSGPEAQRLLEDERRNKTLSFVGFAGGLVAAGIATALFAF